MIALLLLAFGYFGFTTFQNTTAYFLTVDELLEKDNPQDLGSVRVKGKLIVDSFNRDSGSMVAQFKITEGDAILAVTHQGLLPDLFFNEHSEIILSGQYGKDKIFSSDRVMVKCPSKYQSAEYEKIPDSYSQQEDQS